MRSLLLLAVLCFQFLNFAARFGQPAGRRQRHVGRRAAGRDVDATVAGLVGGDDGHRPDGRYRLALAPRHAASAARADERIRRRGLRHQATRLGAVAHDFTLQLAAVADEVVVTAIAAPESRSTTTESLRGVSPRRTSRRSARTSLVDVLRMVPGLNVESTGREGALSSLFARGGESDYNLVLIDGVRVNPSGGAYDFSRVSAAEIDRLEVVRGGQSSLYGSDAIGSVVQVFTKRAAPGDAPRIAGSIEGGSFDTVRGDAALLGGARRRVDYQLGAAYRGTERRLPGHPARITTRSSRRRSTPASARSSAIARRCAPACATPTPRAKAIGPIDYGSRDTGTAADTRDLSWHLDFSHRICGSRSIRPAQVNYFKSYRLSADTIADPTFQVYTILSGTPGALFPNSPRLVQLLDAATFASYQNGSQAAGGRSVPRENVVRRQRFPVDDHVGVPPAGVPLSGERDLGRQSDAQRRLRLRARKRSAEPVVPGRGPRVLRAAAVPRAGSLAGDARRAARSQHAVRR